MKSVSLSIIVLLLCVSCITSDFKTALKRDRQLRQQWFHPTRSIKLSPPHSGQRTNHMESSDFVFNTTHDCSQDGALTLHCKEYSGCPPGWKAGFSKCYKPFLKANNFRHAARICAEEGASLVSIESKEENHFLSDLLTNLNLGVHQWYTGGKFWKSKWQWHKLVEKKRRRNKKRGGKNKSSYKTMRATIKEKLWFRGWRLLEHKYSEPESEGKKTCLALSNRFKNPSSGRLRKVGYFFWKTNYCKHPKGIAFVCQKDNERVQSPLTGVCGHRPYDHKDLLFRRRRSTIVTHEKHWSPPALSPQTRVPKIGGGKSASPGEFPWQAQIRRIIRRRKDFSFYDEHLCGATIISKHWLLTAAHCFDPVKYSTHLRVVVNTTENISPKPGGVEQVFKVEEIVKHENYNSTTFDADIALVKVKAENGGGMIFEDYVQPACLPAADTPYVKGTECFISGWGVSKNGYVHSKNLQGARVPLIKNSRCRKIYNGSIITRRMMCAGYMRGGVDTCSGDSGGPLVCKVEGSYRVMGITSWGDSGCALDHNPPGVYTKVQKFLPWIFRTINE